MVFFVLQVYHKFAAEADVVSNYEKMTGQGIIE